MTAGQAQVNSNPCITMIPMITVLTMLTLACRVVTDVRGVTSFAGEEGEGEGAGTQL